MVGALGPLTVAVLLAAPAERERWQEPDVVQAVDGALDWLVSAEREGGGFSADVGYKLNWGYRKTEQDVRHRGVTALACLAFLSAGDLEPRRRDVLERGLALLAEGPNSATFADEPLSSDLVSRAFATIALAEAHARSHPAGRAAQAYVDSFVAKQLECGGWLGASYSEQPAVLQSSVVLAALTMARRADVQVDVIAIERAERFVEENLDAALAGAPSGEERGHFAFWFAKLLAADGEEGRVTYERTAAAVLRLRSSDGSFTCEVGPGRSFATAVAALVLCVPRDELVVLRP